MTDAPRNAWQCPTCGRHIPRNVEVCRCGTERRRLEELGYSFEKAAAPDLPARPAARRRVESHGPAAALIGYRIDTDLGAGWRATLKTISALAVIGVGVLMVRVTYAPPRPTRGNVQVLTTLEEFTRTSQLGSANTIPAFLSSPGKVGALAVTGTPDDPVRPINEVELRLGFCTPNVARLIRYEYPGYYDSWPDAKLEKTVLEKHPEYETRVCMVSTRLDAASGEILKYEYLPRSIGGHAWALLQALIVMTVFAVGCLNVYYRLIVGRLAPQG